MSPQVVDTLVLLNNTLVPGNFIATFGASPWDVAYDPNKGEVFVANANGNSVGVISDSSNTIVANIAVGGIPYALAYDSGKGEVFVAISAGAGTVTVISDANNTVVASIPVGSFPRGLAYDSGKGEVFVANVASGSVSVVSDANNSVVANVPVGSSPDGVAYGSGKGVVFVTNQGSNTVSIISDANNTVVASVQVGSSPYGVAYDSKDGEAFVANLRSSNVSVIWASTFQVVGTVPVGTDPWGVAYDSGKGEVFVAQSYSQNVSVISAATNQVVANISIKSIPFGVAYDGGKGEVFVAEYWSDNVSAISDATDKVVANIIVGATPEGVVFDTARGEVFVADFFTHNVSVISAVSSREVARISMGAGTGLGDMVYDGGRGEVFVTVGSSDRSGVFSDASVRVISDTNNTVVATIPLGSGPSGLAYDSGRGEVFVASSNVVSVISDTNNTVVATIAVGLGPRGVTYDGGKGEVFVTNYDSKNVSVISDANNTVVASIPVRSHPTGVVYDSGKSEVFITTYYPHFCRWPYHCSPWYNVSVISDATNTVVASIPVSGYATTVAYDGGKGEVFVAEPNSNLVKVISDASRGVVASITVGLGPEFIAVDSCHQRLYISNSVGGTMSIASFRVAASCPTVSAFSADPSTTFPGSPTTFTVVASGGVGPLTYHYDGLPPGCAGQNTSALVCTPNRTGAYLVTAHVNDSAGNGTSATTSLTVILPSYAVIFAESGLPRAMSWSVTLNGTSHTSTMGTVAFYEPNGTYSFTVGTRVGYVASPSSGSVAVDGGPVGQSIAFESSIRYVVNLTETGLPSGMSWAVTLNGTLDTSTNRSITFSEPNGSYSFAIGSVVGYAPRPSSGPVTVNGGPVAEQIAFASTAPPLYPVTFTENGLPSGTNWSVTLNGTALASTTAVITFSEPNGTYSFNLGPVAGYAATPGAGPLTVFGAVVIEPISFVAGTPGEYVVTFTETGLPSGTIWSVTMGGGPEYSKTATIKFLEFNGSYSFNVGVVTGYVSRVAPPALVTVTGANQGVSVTFAPPSSGVGLFGLPQVEAYELIGGIVLAVVAVAGALFLVRGRRTRPS